MEKPSVAEAKLTYGEKINEQIRQVLNDNLELEHTKLTRLNELKKQIEQDETHLTTTNWNKNMSMRKRIETRLKDEKSRLTELEADDKIRTPEILTTEIFKKIQQKKIDLTRFYYEGQNEAIQEMIDEWLSRKQMFHSKFTPPAEYIEEQEDKRKRKGFVKKGTSNEKPAEKEQTDTPSKTERKQNRQEVITQLTPDKNLEKLSEEEQKFLELQQLSKLRKELNAKITPDKRSVATTLPRTPLTPAVATSFSPQNSPNPFLSPPLVQLPGRMEISIDAFNTTTDYEKAQPHLQRALMFVGRDRLVDLIPPLQAYVLEKQGKEGEAKTIGGFNRWNKVVEYIKTNKIDLRKFTAFIKTFKNPT